MGQPLAYALHGKGAPSLAIQALLLRRWRRRRLSLRSRQARRSAPGRVPRQHFVARCEGNTFKAPRGQPIPTPPCRPPRGNRRSPFRRPRTRSGARPRRSTLQHRNRRSGWRAPNPLSSIPLPAARSLAGGMPSTCLRLRRMRRRVDISGTLLMGPAPAPAMPAEAVERWAHPRDRSESAIDHRRRCRRC